MEQGVLEMWKENLEKRHDLALLYKSKEINISLVDEDKSVRLSFKSGEISIDKRCSDSPDLVIETSGEIIDQLISGKEKVSNIPPNSIKISGKYRDVLFLESVFFLNGYS